MIKIGSDFSGVGAFNQALKRLGIDYEELFACDMDKYARQTFIHNYGEPKYYPTNVYDRAIPTESLDIYMTSPPCQAFSLAGKRLGKDDKRGILFFNSYELIQTNRPRYFIFENVKGLLSDDGGKTFSEWVNMLGGKSVNGNPVIFPYEECVPYHIYWKVLNAKDYGVPQNRERVFIIGIRDDVDNNFSFPPEEQLKIRLKDLLDENVNEKYFLNDKQINSIVNSDFIQEKSRIQNNDFCATILSRDYKSPKCVVHDIQEMVKVRKYEVDILKLQSCLKKHRKSVKYISEELNVNKTTVEHWFRTDKHFTIPDAEIWFQLKKCLNINTTEFDLSITEFIEKEGVFEKANRVYDEEGIAPTMTSSSFNEKILTKVIQLNPSKESNGQQPFQQNRVYDINGIMTTLDTDSGRKSVMIHNCITEAIGRQGSSSEFIDSCKKVYGATSKIRRLTPRECFRLMDFPDTFDFSVVSESQAYKQAGNSIVVAVLAKIINRLKLK